MIPTAYLYIFALLCVPYNLLSSIIRGAQNFGLSTSFPTSNDHGHCMECLHTRGLVYSTPSPGLL